MEGVNGEVKKGDTFDVGSKVLRNGTYICVPCGYRSEFSRGDTFPQCFGCLKGKKYEGDDYIKDLGLWELIKEA